MYKNFNLCNIVSRQAEMSNNNCINITDICNNITLDGDTAMVSILTIGDIAVYEDASCNLCSDSYIRIGEEYEILMEIVKSDKNNKESEHLSAEVDRCTLRIEENEIDDTGRYKFTIVGNKAIHFKPGSGGYLLISRIRNVTRNTSWVTQTVDKINVECKGKESK